jgi:hypothetical protein
VQLVEQLFVQTFHQELVQYRQRRSKSIVSSKRDQLCLSVCAQVQHWLMLEG